MIAQFTKAQPVWLPEDRDGMNIQAIFSAEFAVVSEVPEDLVLRISGASLFRVFINGTFCHYGPAKAGHGFTRQDTVDISSYVRTGANRIDIEVSSYNCANYYFTHRAPFLQAEIVGGNEILAATGDAGFSCSRMAERHQKVIRYSFQRGFTDPDFRMGGAEMIDRAVERTVDVIGAARAAGEEPKETADRHLRQIQGRVLGLLGG